MNRIVMECNTAYLGTPCPKIKKLKEYVCSVYASPSLKWAGERKCPFRNEVSEDEQKKQINPLKASKKASKRS
jgi:hypothetical protein